MGRTIVSQRMILCAGLDMERRGAIVAPTRIGNA